jgi:hypothetical protein
MQRQVLQQRAAQGRHVGRGNPERAARQGCGMRQPRRPARQQTGALPLLDETQEVGARGSKARRPVIQAQHGVGASDRRYTPGRHAPANAARLVEHLHRMPGIGQRARTGGPGNAGSDHRHP